MVELIIIDVSNTILAFFPDGHMRKGTTVHFPTFHFKTLVSLEL